MTSNAEIERALSLAPVGRGDCWRWHPAHAQSPSAGHAAFHCLKLALIGTGIDAILVGIGMAGACIYNNWTGISTAFEAFKRGVWLLFLPSYSPALNPIEMVFSKLKALLRKKATRTFDTLCDTLGDNCHRIQNNRLLPGKRQRHGAVPCLYAP